jgi:regulator of protease activity HflC (stomatin/prohibitin superfamily)
MIILIVESIPYWIDTRVLTSWFKAEKTLTKDTVPAEVDAVLFWKIIDPQKAALDVAGYQSAINWASQPTLRPSLPAETTTTIPASHACSTAWQYGVELVARVHWPAQRQVDHADVVGASQLDGGVNRGHHGAVAALARAVQGAQADQSDTANGNLAELARRVAAAAADDAGDVRPMSVAVPVRAPVAPAPWCA